MRLADSHCHLNYKGLAEDQPNVLERARASGVEAMLNIATRESEWDAVLGVAEREPDVWATVGIHPHEADQHPDVDTAKLVERARHPRIVGIGESGLDYYYDHSDRAQQQASFRSHLAACRETGLPIIVHTRDAEADTLAILEDELGKGAFPGVIHCFTASGAFADAALDLGFYISISGIVTFKNARDLQETATRLPIERLLIETDAPFLAPVPHRGTDRRTFVCRGHLPLPGEATRRECRGSRRADAGEFPRVVRENDRVKVRILGCGTSSGVPRIGGDWGACDPSEPRNRRTRVSILVEHRGTRILVDTSPDLREQLLSAGVNDVDAVIWTHDHADHCHGIDDLRQVYHARGAPIRGLARPATLDSLRRRFAYVFSGNDGYPPTIVGDALPDETTIGEFTVRCVDQPHGSITSAGLRFELGRKSLVYATDLNALTDDMHFLYKGADVMIIDALRRAPHPTHPTVEQAASWAHELGVGQTLLTHMDQSMDYQALRAELPPGIAPAFDGMEIEL